MSFKPETACVAHAEIKGQVDNSGSISMPIYQTATFEHIAFDQSTGYDYSRLQNPTKAELEAIVKRLEHGSTALAFSSGMAAITLMFELLDKGDHIIVGDDLYGGTIRLFDHVLERHDIKISTVDTADLVAIEQAITPTTKLIFIETPTNPMMRVSDIAAVSELAHQHNLLVAVDNTFLSPYYQNPLVLGADIVIHSGTKFLSGHNDTLAGFLVVADDVLGERLQFIAKTVGSGLAPFDCWLTIRGIKTLAIRIKQAQENAIKIFDFLKNHHKVNKVYYIGDPTHPGFAVNNKQASGYGSMISFEVDSNETAQGMLNRVELISFAESLGGVESLITYPITQTHADVPLDILEKNGINHRLLRLSVGIEHVDDLIADLCQALEGN